MSRMKAQRFLFAAAAIAVLIALTACQNISYGKLAANYHFGRANSFFRENQYRKAITEYEATLKYNPNMTQAYRFLGESYKQLYKPGVDTPLNKDLEEKTLAALTKAYEIEPNNRDIIYSLGDMYDKLKKYDEAEKLYLRIIELQPENMDNYYVVAEFYKRYAADNKDVARKAESMYLRRIETDPENPQGYAYMAQFLQESSGNPQEMLKSYESAADFWQRRITLQPDSAEAWLALGVAVLPLPVPEHRRTAQDGPRGPPVDLQGHGARSQLSRALRLDGPAVQGGPGQARAREGGTLQRRGRPVS